MYVEERGGARAYHDLAREARPEATCRRTYNLDVGVVERLDKAALALRVGQSDLACWLLHRALRQVENGAWEIHVKAPRLRFIDWDGEDGQG